MQFGNTCFCTEGVHSNHLIMSAILVKWVSNQEPHNWGAFLLCSHQEPGIFYPINVAHWCHSVLRPYYFFTRFVCLSVCRWFTYSMLSKIDGQLANAIDYLISNITRLFVASKQQNECNKSADLCIQCRLKMIKSEIKRPLITGLSNIYALIANDSISKQMHQQHSTINQASGNWINARLFSSPTLSSGAMSTNIQTKTRTLITSTPARLLMRTRGRGGKVNKNDGVMKCACGLTGPTP